MAYTAPPHTAKQIVNAFSVETTYGTYVAPAFSFGTGCTITHHSKNNSENQQPIARETMFEELPVTLTKKHSGNGEFNLCYGKPLQFIGSGVYNRQIGGAGANYNHIVNFLSKTMNSFSMIIARRHTTPFNTAITSAYMKSLSITGALGEIVKCAFEYNAYDATDNSTNPTVTETTYPETLMSLSPITMPLAASPNGIEIGYVTKIDVKITKEHDEKRNLAASAPYLQTEPALMEYSVEGNFTIKLYDKEFWDMFQAETLKITTIAMLNRLNIVFTKTATDKMILTFGDIYITEDEIPSPKEGIIEQTFHFTAHNQSTMITGTATGTTAYSLVDTGKTFTAGTEGAFIHNTTDDTWAMVTQYVSANIIYLSADIMTSGETYEIFRPAVSIMSVDQLTTH
jgi:hypothetical protein